MKSILIFCLFLLIVTGCKFALREFSTAIGEIEAQSKGFN